MRLGAEELPGGNERIPVRMLNEYAFCPRLFHLEFVQREFVDNEFTVEGNLAHRRVDAGGGTVAPPEDPDAFKARSVELSSDLLGISAKIDLVEGADGVVRPVDYKRGSPPENEHRCWEPERVQLCAYGLLLREAGYRCEEGILYFAEAKTRVEVPFDKALIDRTLQIVNEARRTAGAREAPPPLVASPKCQGCSLHSICLPDEVNILKGDAGQGTVRHFVPGRDDAKPLYVTEQGAQVGLSGDVLHVRGRERQPLAEARLIEVSQVVLVGNVQITAQAARELMTRGVPICWTTYGGWLSGLSDGLGHGNVELRRAQFRAADDEGFCRRLAGRLVRTKIYNSRTMLRRNHEALPDQVPRELALIAEACGEAEGIGTLLGLEGNAARVYFENFDGMLRSPEGEGVDFDFKHRSRRPPRDPVNALLSFGYSLLAREVAVAVRAVGLDPFLGFYHRPRFGRPALALDLMEEFRPLLADSVALTLINGGMVKRDDFVRSSLGVALKSEARRTVLRAWERRLGEEITHPVFGYRISYRRVIEVQVRLFARFLLGEIAEFPEFRTR